MSVIKTQKCWNFKTFIIYLVMNIGLSFLYAINISTGCQHRYVEDNFVNMKMEMYYVNMCCIKSLNWTHARLITHARLSCLIKMNKTYLLNWLQSLCDAPHACNMQLIYVNMCILSYLNCHVVYAIFIGKGSVNNPCVSILKVSCWHKKMYANLHVK